MAPLVTVCLPVFNGNQFLADALESILSQSLSDFELLVADDCSTDGSFDVIEEFARQDRRVKAWRNHKRLGLFANYNQCLRNAMGTYVKPMAQDDWIAPGMLDACVNVLSTSPRVSLVSAGRRIVDETGEDIDEDDHEDAHNARLASLDAVLGRRDIYPSAEITRACINPLRNLIGEPCTVMFRAEAAGQGFSEELNHLGDLELWLRVLRHGDFGFIPDKLVKFRRHDRSATARNTRQLLIASDIAHMADLCEESIARAGLTKEKFLAVNLSGLGAIIADEMSTGRIGESTLIGNERLTKADEFGLKKALLYCLAMTEGAQEIASIKARRISKVELAEQRTRLLFESFPWRSTRILRDLNRAIGNPQPNSDTFSGTSPQKFTSTSQYLSFLKRQRKRILKSRSWKIGREVQSLLKSMTVR